MLKLEKMQLSGFKSFSDRTELQFPEGITAVVGARLARTLLLLLRNAHSSAAWKMG